VKCPLGVFIAKPYSGSFGKHARRTDTRRTDTPFGRVPNKGRKKKKCRVGWVEKKTRLKANAQRWARRCSRWRDLDAKDVCFNYTQHFDEIDQSKHTLHRTEATLEKKRIMV
jgi:hypothetical protein